MDNLTNLYHEYDEMLIGNRARLSAVYFTQAQSLDLARKYSLCLTRYLISDILKLDEHTAASVLTYEILRQFKLEFYIKKYVEIPSLIPTEERISFIVQAAFSDKQRENSSYMLETYSKVIHNKVGMPKSFFKTGIGYIRASQCLQLAIEEFMLTDKYDKYFVSVNDLYKFFSNIDGKEQDATVNDFLYDAHLKDPCNQFYNHPIDFLHMSLSNNQKNNFIYNYYKFMIAYKKPIKKGGGK